jgi:hypothetical protein
MAPAKSEGNGLKEGIAGKLADRKSADGRGGSEGIDRRLLIGIKDSIRVGMGGREISGIAVICGRNSL